MSTERAAAWARVLESAVNRVLRLDPELGDALGTLAGSTVRVTVDPGPDLLVTIVADGVRLRPPSDEPPDVALRGALPALLALVEDPGALPAGLHVTGDLALLQSLRQAASRLQIDWEEVLARRLGDAPAHHLARAARGAFGWGRAASTTIAADAVEYLVEEVRWLAARWPVEQFYEQVDVLRDDVDRLEQRVERLARAVAIRGDEERGERMR